MHVVVEVMSVCVARLSKHDVEFPHGTHMTISAQYVYELMKNNQRKGKLCSHSV